MVNAELKMLPTSPTAKCWDRVNLKIRNGGITKVVWLADRNSALGALWQLENDKDLEVDGQSYDLNAEERVAAADALGQYYEELLYVEEKVG